MSDHTPTQPLNSNDRDPSQIAAADGGGAAAAANDVRSKRSIIILGSVGAALLLALLIVTLVLLTRADGAPGGSPSPTDTSTSTPTATVSPTPSASPTPSHTPPAPAPPAPSQPEGEPPPSEEPWPHIELFLLVIMSPHPFDCQEAEYLGVSWIVSDADQVFFGVDTDDASVDPLFANLPHEGDSSDFPPGNDPFEYACPSPSHTYTLTVIGTNGEKVSRTATWERVPDTE